LTGADPAAKTLLAETNLPIKQIAQQAGFQTVQYLTRTFGRLTAIPRRVSPPSLRPVARCLF